MDLDGRYKGRINGIGTTCNIAHTLQPLCLELCLLGAAMEECIWDWVHALYDSVQK